MPLLLLLNGPPASGKSTLADRLVARRSLALNLDVDVVRAQLGGWLDRPAEAGVAARALARSMATVHLTAGHDVVVPQFLARVGFIEELEQVANNTGSMFVEIALQLTRTEAIEAFEHRSRNPDNRHHTEAAELVDRSDGADPVGAMHDALERLLNNRANVRRVRVVRGDREATLRQLLDQLHRLEVDW